MGSTDPDGGTPSLPDAIGGCANVLLLVPPFHPADLEACMALLTLEPPERENVWSLGVTLPPNKRVENWQAHVGRAPRAFRVVSVGDQAQDRAEAVARTHGFDPEPHFATVPDGGALTRIGVELVSALEAWADADAETVVCVHSVSALLQYADEGHVFRFLNAFTTEVEAAGATAHYHLDPEAHDTSTVARVKQLVDAVVEADGDDGYGVVVR